MKILLLSDTTLCINAGGSFQTLYNLFSFSENKNILCITPSRSFKEFPPSEPFVNSYITYNYEIIKVPNHRFAKYVNPYIERLNYIWNAKFRRFENIKEQIRNFNPDLVVSCSNGPIALFMHHKLMKGFNDIKVFPYFMDDWMLQKRYKWLDPKIYLWASKILSENLFWLMISRELGNILQKRYNVQPNGILEVHNPVDLSNAPELKPVKNKEAYTLVYGGSLWPMHFDAFLIMAKSIHLLNVTRKIKLIVYTAESIWNWRKTELEPLGVVYGGSIPYKDIHQKLGEADALILSSSFSKEWYTHSKGSIQTKITDYLKVKRLIISCGPDYAANHKFLKRHRCGVCIETCDVNAVAEILNKILNNIVSYEEMVINGWEVLKNEFSYTKVHSKLINYFLDSDNSSFDHTTEPEI